MGTAGILRRHRQETEVRQWTAAAAIPTVSIVMPQPGPAATRLVLPGDVEAWYEAPIYARVNGYVKDWYFDYGARVKKGDLLAEIETPDLDQQLRQAEADVVRAKANENLAAITAKRWRVLLETHSVSQEATDEKIGDLEAKTAALAAARATVQKLEAFESFKYVIAPFTGVVTARKTDIGDLINAGSGHGRELFRVADVHEMRTFVQVPQQLAAGMRPGLRADLLLPQYPARIFPATVATTSNAINRGARTLLVELHSGNPDGLLQPGAYAEVHFCLPRNFKVLRIPTSALLFRKGGLKVAVVGADNRIELRPIKVGRDLGTQVDILTGITRFDRVVNRPPDSLAGGEIVRIAGQVAPGAGPAGENPDAERAGAEQRPQACSQVPP
ncbi:MAG: efflux RND transporter periplasmic adaptor subunit [Magnetospirillum sp.]|nr:efflux RND transporter periplasmic adaptor subunit [Magnetospirillum sp.]